MSATESDDPPFIPIRLLIEEDSDQSVIGVEDEAGRFVGITVSPRMSGVLRQVLPSSGERLVALWNSYENDRGAGPFFFSDLTDLLKLIELHPELSALRKLTGFHDGRQVFHDVIVGTILSIATQQGLNPRLVPTDPPRQTPDLEIFAPGRIPVEVKTLTRASVVDFLDGGIAINVRSSRYLREGALRVCREGFAQAPRGIVVLAVWCDFAGTIAGASPHWSSLRMDGPTLQSDEPCVLLRMRTNEGESWYRVAQNQWEDTLSLLMSDLRTPRNVPLPLTGGVVNVVRGATWMKIGRTFTAGNTMDSYGEEELAMLALAQERVVDVEFGSAASDAYRQAQLHLEAVRRTPFAPGQPIPLSDDRLTSIFRAAVGLCALVPHLCVVSGDDRERPVNDCAALRPGLAIMHEGIQADDGTRVHEGFRAVTAVVYWNSRLVRLAGALFKLSSPG